ncbi:MAG: putative cysteine protease [Capsulimonas sp.]|nr:putative cysteine protease [Capsulimonas sp.]
MTTATAPAPFAKTLFRLPWSAEAAIFVAYAALLINDQRYALIGAFAVLLHISRYFALRIPQRSWIAWIIRIAAYGLIGSTAGRNDQGNVSLFDPATVDAFGVICAVEIVIQMWRERPGGSPPGAITIALAALVLSAASTTYDTTYIRWLAPLYIVFTMLSLRSYTRRQNVVQSGAATRPNWRVLGARGAALLLGLGAGFVVYSAFVTYHDKINQIGDNVMTRQHAPERSALSSSPSLGDSFDNDGSPSRVLRIKNLIGVAHLRGLVFDTYKHGSWSPTLEARKFFPAGDRVLLPNARGARAHVTCFADGLHILVAPLNVAGVGGPELGSIERSAEIGNPLKTDVGAPYYYDLILPPNEENQGILCATPTPEERQHCLNVPPEITPEVRALAQKIAGNEPDDRSKVQAVTNYLISNYSYSLNVHIGKGDKVSEFLLHQKAAYCEYFGSAAVILLRCVGVPSRYATGYYAHEGEAGGETVVRQRDSHAWAESWIEGVGWVTVDATPGGGRPDKLYPDTPAGMKIWETLADKITDIREWLAQFSPAALGGAAFGLLLLYAGVRALLARRRGGRTVLRESDYTPIDEELRQIAARFETVLKRVNAPCPPARPWGEHLKKLTQLPKAEQPDLDFERADDFVRCYNLLRFRRDADPALRRETTDLIDTLERGLTGSRR